MLYLKPSVDLVGLSQGMLMGHLVVLEVYRDHKAQCIITSANDSKHGNTSLHYDGDALDYRTRHISEDMAESIRADVRSRLPVDFDVILHPKEVDADTGVITKPGHLHVEYQRRRPA